MNTADYLKKYISLIDFLADTCGTGCEVVLHDVSSPDFSIIAIRNPLSGNSIGVPLSGLSVNFHDAVYENRKFVANYIEQIEGKQYLSSAFFIRKDSELIGVICVNKDLTSIKECSLAINSILSQYNLAFQDSDENDHNDNPVVTLLNDMISDAINDAGVPPARMSLNEKVRLVHKLSASGVLMIDGAISEIAARLSISEPTVYRYLNRRVS